MDAMFNTPEDAAAFVKEAAAPVGPKDHEAEVAAAVKRMNEKYMMVKEGGKAVIFQMGFDPILKRRKIDRLSQDALKLLYLNDRIQTGLDEQGRPTYKTAANIWLSHAARRQFIDGVTFDPTSTKSTAGVLNLWQGFAMKPKAGSWSLMRAHVLDVLCDGNQAHANYLIGWMAYMVQHPAEQGEVAVVMKGSEGCGKGTLARALLRIMGQHGLAISNAKHLVGNFNAHLRDCIFLFADEAFFAGDKAHVGVLKSIITEPHLTVEAKYQDAVTTPNFLHLMMASNEAWVIPASLEARRFFVLEPNDTAKGNHQYFADIWAEMDAGGYAAMLYDLLALDLTHFDVRAVPATEGLQQQKKLSLPTPEAWWKDCLERGYVFRSRLGLGEHFAMWLDVVTMELLVQSYTEFAKDHGERRLLSREDLGRFMRRMECRPMRPRKGLGGEHIVDKLDDLGRSRRVSDVIILDQPPSYNTLGLSNARGAFNDVTGLSVEWESLESYPERQE